VAELRLRVHGDSVALTLRLQIVGVASMTSRLILRHGAIIYVVERIPFGDPAFAETRVNTQLTGLDVNELSCL
jgi:hypothetical protein